MTDYQDFECLENAEQTARRDRLGRMRARLPGAVRRVANYGADPRKLGDFTPEDAVHPDKWAEIPVLRKQELLTLQTPEAPLAGINTVAPGDFGRLFQSPGPIYTAESYATDPWSTARALFAAGFRPHDIVLNCFAYHLSPGGFMIDGGLRALDCTVIPAGPGNTLQQLQVIRHFLPQAYTGTPSFLRILLEAADAEGITWTPRALVSGEALPADLRAWFDGRGVRVQQAYATADVGMIAYESHARNGLFLDDNVFVEIVEVGGQQECAPGEIGEVVVTRFHQEYPLLRFGTGDLSAFVIDPTPSPCGRTATRLKGWLGRADGAVKVRGQFLHPAQLADFVARANKLAPFQAAGVSLMAVAGEVTRDGANDHLKLQYQAAAPLSDELNAAAVALFKELCKLRTTLAHVPELTPNAIVDAR